MELKKYRWSKAYESAEEELVGLLAAKNIQTEHWIAEANEAFDDRMYGLERKLWCAEGSIKIFIAGNKDISLQPGDALDIPAYTVHGALAGINGAICYEAPLPVDNPIIPLEK